jgi:hypothetical protein
VSRRDQVPSREQSGPPGLLALLKRPVTHHALAAFSCRSMGADIEGYCMSCDELWSISVENVLPEEL